MILESDTDINNIFELFRDSYKNIDFRSALYKKHDSWNRILTILRFSNNSEMEISNHYKDLNLKKYETENFKIEYKIFEVSEWEDLIIELYNEMNEDLEIYDIDEFRYNENQYEEYKSTFLDEFKALLNTPSRRFFYTEEEVKNHNHINFYYILPNKNKHHNKFYKILNEEILGLGEDDIYDVLNRTLQLEGYSSHNSLFISIIFPIYINLKDLVYSHDVLSGKVYYHNIFNGSKIFIRIYSEPNYQNNSLKGVEELIINKDNQDTKPLKNEFYESPFQIDFSNYDCDPNFIIRVLWERFPKIYLIDFQKSFGSPRYLKSFEELGSEIIDDNDQQEIAGLRYQFIIDPDIAFKDDYKEIIADINNAYRKGFFNCVYILIRKLLENLLIDCLRKYYTMQKVEKFFDDDKNKFLPFSELRINFNKMINDKDFKASVGQVQQVIIDYLEIFKETGDASAHSFFSINHHHLIEQNRDKLIILLNQFVKIHNRLFYWE